MSECEISVVLFALGFGYGAFLRLFGSVKIIAPEVIENMPVTLY